MKAIYTTTNGTKIEVEINAVDYENETATVTALHDAPWCYWTQGGWCYTNIQNIWIGALEICDADAWLALYNENGLFRSDEQIALDQWADARREQRFGCQL